ncbi:phospholipase, partial [Enterobacter hormaechei]
SEVSISPLFRWPNSVNHFTSNKAATVIDEEESEEDIALALKF